MMNLKLHIWRWFRLIRDRNGRSLCLQACRALKLETLEERWLPTFVAPTLFATGLAPEAVAVVDLNGDGLPDLVTANVDAGTVSVLLGNCDGSFQPHVDYPAGGGSLETVVAADLNGDGIPDLVTLNSNTGSVYVLLGNGDGSFGPPTPYFAGAIGAGSVAVGDLTGNGIPDLVVPGGASHTVSVLLGNGDGTFQPKTDVPTGGYPLSVAVADLAGNGKADIVATNSGTTVSVLLGNGNGTFQAPQDYEAGSSLLSLAIQDFNGDGILDLATADFKGNTVSVLLGNGDGSFQTAAHYAVGAERNQVVAADLTGDGVPDLVVGFNLEGTVEVLRGRGDGTFGSPVSYATGTARIAVADVTSDTIPDIVVASPPQNAVSVLRGNGDGTFYAPVTQAVGFAPDQVVVGDFNGDGIPDLAVVNANYSGTVSILLGNGDGTYQPAINAAAGTTPYNVAVGDFNGDGILDLAVANNVTAGTVSIFLGNGDGTFQAPVSYATAGVSADAVAVGHFDGDSDLDLAVANYTKNASNGTVCILLGNGDGTFQPAQTYAVGTNPNAVVVGDFNGDGHDDLAVSNEGLTTSGSGSSVSVLLGNGDGTFQPAENYAVGTKPVALALGDFTGTGKLDLVMANKWGYNLSVLLGNGDGSFQPAVKYDLSNWQAPVSVAVGDFRHNGLVDLAAADKGGKLSLLLGNSDGTFQVPLEFGGGGYLAAADLTSDGRTDLAVTMYAPGNNAPGYAWAVLNDGNWPSIAGGGPGLAPARPSMDLPTKVGTLRPTSGLMPLPSPNVSPIAWSPSPLEAQDRNAINQANNGSTECTRADYGGPNSQDWFTDELRPFAIDSRSESSSETPAPEDGTLAAFDLPV
jgi:hypothetical protein